jgi:ParB/Sulfiredoxin domain
VRLPATWIETRDLPLAELRRYPGNARRGDTAEIRKSVRRHGQYRPIVVRQHDHRFTILAGNHTADAMELEGHTSARCEIIRCTDDEAQRINLADNKIAALGTDDPEALLALVGSLEEDLTGTGYDLDDVDDLVAATGRVPVMAPGPTGARYAESDEELAERAAKIAAYQPALGQGQVEIILVMTITERDEFMDLIKRVRKRDGDAPAGEIVVAALTAWTGAAA